MNRRSFLGCSSLAAAGILSRGSLADAWALGEDTTPSPIITTSTGKLRGISDNKVYAFKGISYGAPTGGAKRFLRRQARNHGRECETHWISATALPRAHQP